jgi:hypothetical protein
LEKIAEDLRIPIRERNDILIVFQKTEETGDPPEPPVKVGTDGIRFQEEIAGKDRSLHVFPLAFPADPEAPPGPKQTAAGGVQQGIGELEVLVFPSRPNLKGEIRYRHGVSLEEMSFGAGSADTVNAGSAPAV